MPVVERFLDGSVKLHLRQRYINILWKFEPQPGRLLKLYLKLKHPNEKNSLIEITRRYGKGRIEEGFDDYIPYRKNDSNLNHVRITQF